MAATNYLRTTLTFTLGNKVFLLFRENDITLILNISRKIQEIWLMMTEDVVMVFLKWSGFPLTYIIFCLSLMFATLFYKYKTSLRAEIKLFCDLVLFDYSTTLDTLYIKVIESSKKGSIGESLKKKKVFIMEGLLSKKQQCISPTFSSSSLVHAPLISSGSNTLYQRCWHWCSVWVCTQI